MTAATDLHPDVLAALEELEGMPTGAEKVRRAEKVLATAQAVGGFDNEYWARIYLTQALFFVPQDPGTLEHFLWLRRALDENPGLDADDRRTILWRLKWALGLMLTSPDIAVGEIESAIVDLESRLIREGYQLRPVHQYRAWLAEELGRPDEIHRHVQRWLDTPRDLLSDCEACEYRDQALRLQVFDPRAALDYLHPVVSGAVTCAEEPAWSLAIQMSLAVDLDDVPLALESHRRGWRLCHNDPMLSTAMARHLLSLTRLGNVDRAVTHLLPRLDWLDRLRDCDEREQFSAVAAIVLDAASEQGLAPDTIRGTPTSQVRAQLWSVAHSCAERFAARSGSTFHPDRLRSWAEQGHAKRVPALRPATGRDADDAMLERINSDIPLTSIREVGERVRRRLVALDGGLGIELRHWLAHREPLIANAKPEDWADIALLDRWAAREVSDSRGRQLLDHSVAAAERSRNSTSVKSARGHRAAMTGERELARHLADELSTSRDWGEAAELWWFISYYAAPDEREAAARRAADLFGRARLPLHQAAVMIYTARTVAESNPSTAATLLDEALGLRTVPRRHFLKSVIADTQARVSQACGDLIGARMHAAYAVDASSAAPENRQRARMTLCSILLELGDWTALHRESHVLTNSATSSGDPICLAKGHRWSGLAEFHLGRAKEAIGLLEQSLPVLVEVDPAAAADTALVLGMAFRQERLLEEASATLEQARLLSRAADDTATFAQSEYESGVAARMRGNLRSASEHVLTARDLAREHGLIPLFVAASREYSYVLAERGDIAASVSELDAVLSPARTMAAECDDWNGEIDMASLEAELLFDTAHVLESSGNLAGAMRRLEWAERAGRDIILRARFQTERSRLLALSGRIIEAKSLLEAAALDLPGDYSDRRLAAQEAIDAVSQPEPKPPSQPSPQVESAGEQSSA